MPQADCLKTHAARCRELARAAEYPLMATALIEQAEEYEALALHAQRQQTLH